MTLWVNGDLVDAGQPVLRADDHGVTVGDGVFETMKVVDGQPFALRRHLDRLVASASGLGLTVAGRTDAGVHASGQVVHADVPAAAWTALTGHGAGPLARLAAVLPADVRVHAAGPAPDGFDARFSALWRRYSYRVCDDPARADPLRRHETLWTPRRLDLAAMNEAAASLAGEHDFTSFRAAACQALSVKFLGKGPFRLPGLISLPRPFPSGP